MIDEFDMYLAVQRNEISYYDFQKWMTEQRKSVDEDTWQEAYDEGYSAGSDDGYGQGCEDGECEANG